MIKTSFPRIAVKKAWSVEYEVSRQKIALSLFIYFIYFIIYNSTREYNAFDTISNLLREGTFFLGEGEVWGLRGEGHQ